MKVLLVDDDHELVEILRFALQRAGLTVLTAADSPTALRLLKDERPNIAVLDVNLGEWNGFDLLDDLRRRSDIPVIMLTARDAENDKVRALEGGADDYLTKPFSHRELVARIHAHLRRHNGYQSRPQTNREAITVGPLTLDVKTHTATRHGQPLDLTVTEFRLLHYLMINAGTVVPTRALLKHVWGHDDPGGAEVVRVTLHRLRRKVEIDPTNPQLLHTTPGVGVALYSPT